MAKKRPRSLQKTKKKSSRKISLKPQFKKITVGLFILVFLVVSAAILAYHFISPQQPLREDHLARKTPVKKTAQPKIPAFEIFPVEKTPPSKPHTKPKPSRSEKNKLPKVAIIIDDLGHDQIIADKFLALGAVFTFSLLPHSPFRKQIARAAHKRGFETMLHLPMEPEEYPRVNPGPGVLLTSMSADELISQLKDNLDSVPFVKGVNNHMGSKMSVVSEQLNQIFSILKKKGLFFIDSRTTAETLCYQSARLFRVPFAQRDVFIDHVQEPDFIRNQIKKLVHIAGNNGGAIGIAHPHTLTVNTLRKLLPDLQKKVRLVPASELVHMIG
jgi:polysaccharide deacetylase 2 family uncharacterized protein YibQ